MSNPAIVAAFVGGVIGGLFSLGVLAVSELVKHFVRRREEEKRKRQVRLTVKALYRNAARVLDGTMRLGYLDQPGRFEGTLSFLIERIRKDDIAEAFDPVQADLILTSVPPLLDALHGCLSAHTTYLAGVQTTTDTHEYNEEVRESASVALAFIGLVFTRIGEADFFKNVSEVNANRILAYMEREKAMQAVEVERDKESIKDLKAEHLS